METRQADRQQQGQRPETWRLTSLRAQIEAELAETVRLIVRPQGR